MIVQNTSVVDCLIMVKFALVFYSSSCLRFNGNSFLFRVLVYDLIGTRFYFECSFTAKLALEFFSSARLSNIAVGIEIASTIN